MKVLLFPLFLAIATSSLQAHEKPDAAALVREVRYGQASESYEMDGELVKGREKIRFTLSTVAENDMIRFRFYEPTQVISLELKDNRCVLKEQPAGEEEQELDNERYGERIRGTDVTYEDISQRFLYWPNPKIVDDGKERISFGKRLDAWVVQLNNPRKLGPYSVVKIWIDKKSKALLRVDGFDWGDGPGTEGRKIKRFEVTDVGKDKELGIWVLQEMRVATIDHKGDEKEGTIMKLENPKRKD